MKIMTTVMNEVPKAGDLHVRFEAPGHAMSKHYCDKAYGLIKLRAMSIFNGVLDVLPLFCSFLVPIVAQGGNPAFEQVAGYKILLTQITGSPYVLSAVANKGKIESAYDLRIEHFYPKGSTAGSSYDYDIRKVGDFSSCEYITSLTIPEYTFVSSYPDDLHLKSIREIAVGAFSNCCSLTVARILAPGIVTLPQSCFWGCEKLSEVEMPKITDVGEEAFAGCVGLKKVVFGSGLKSLGNDSFCGVMNLESVSFSSRPPSGLNESHLLDHISLSQISFPDKFVTEWVTALSQSGKDLVVEFRPAGCVGVEAGVPQQLEMICEYADARIYYSIDGSVPTDKSMEYTGPISVVRGKGEDLIVRAIAVSDRWPVDSPTVQTISYTLENCSAPRILPTACTFERTSLDVVISCATDGATIYYTIDGSEPSATNGVLYTGSFTIYETTTVKAIAVKDDWKDSAVVSATFEKSNKLSEAGGLLNYLPESDEAHPWSAVADDSYDGKGAVKSGATSNPADSTWMRVAVPGTGRISFWWKRVGGGNATFKVDGEIAATMGDDEGWQRVTVDVRTAGEHVLRWEYSGEGYILVDGMGWSAVVNDELTNFGGEYDGRGHSIAVAAELDAQANVTYALAEAGPFTKEKPAFTNAVDGTTVWYRVESPDYLGVAAVGSAMVTITAKPLTAGMITVTDACVYDGTAQKPKFTVADGDPSIIADSDWRFVEYSDNVAAGLATVKIAANERGNYCGEAVGTFAIAKASYDMSGVAWSVERSFVYDGQMHGVSLSGLPEGVTATLSGHEAKDAGAYVATANFGYDVANYNAPLVAPCAWEIRKRDLVLRVADKDKSYDGYALSASGGDVSGEGYVDGETLDYYDFTTLTEMGSGTSSFSFRDSASAKASNYNVTVVEGRLRVTIGGSVYAGEVVSAKMRENDPTIMDVKYVVHSVKDTVDVRLVVFKDGVRSFANVIVPEAFADGTEANVGDGVSANTTNTVSWRVSEDWNVDLAKVKVEVLVKPSATYLPFNWVTIPGRNGHPTMKVSTNETDGNDLFNALLWCVADKDAGLVLVDGILKSGDAVLVSGTEPTAAATGFIFGKMGYGVLEGKDLEYVRGALRKPLKGKAKYSRYTVKVIGE